MKNSDKVAEKYLYQVWQEKKFEKELFTQTGEIVNIIDAGIKNDDFAGPDFKNAKIKIGNITYQGDVEIDNYQTDWKSHGHFINKNYNKVILHAVFNSNSSSPFVKTQNGRKVPSVILKYYLSESLRTSIQKAISKEQNNKNNKMPCADLIELIGDKEKLDFILDLGIGRFNKKRKRIYNRLKELAYIKQNNISEPLIRYEIPADFIEADFKPKDFNNSSIWNQLLYELIFEALGYSKNKEIMHKLALTAEISYFQKIKTSNYATFIETCLLKISGLTPEVNSNFSDETIAYLKEIEKNWNKFLNFYDSETFHETQWHFLKSRPQNFPTLRIAGGARILVKILNDNLFFKLLNIVQHNDSDNEIVRRFRDLLIIPTEGYWRNYLLFDSKSKMTNKYFVGLSRADEIIINVILPVLSLYYEIFQLKENSIKVANVFMNFIQKTNNSLVNEIAESLNLQDAWKRSVLYQGMLELFRNYCTKEKCLDCIIGKKIFS